MISRTIANVEESGDLAVIRFEGNITSTSEEAVTGSYKALPEGVRNVLLDFSRVPYMNSSGIGLVIQILMHARNVSQRVLCFGLSPHFTKIFKILGLANYAGLYANETAARAAAG